MMDAIGKDYRPLTSQVGVSPSGSGVQISLLGLNFGLDFNTPALRLPFWGRRGFKDVASPG